MSAIFGCSPSQMDESIDSEFLMLKCVWMYRIGKTHLVELLIVIGAVVVLEPAVLTLVMVSLCLNVGLVFFYV